MLALDNHTAFPAALVPWLDADGADHLTVVVKGTFALHAKRAETSVAAEQAGLAWSDVFHGKPDASSVKYEADASPAKRGTDVILVGHACAPRPVESLDVTLAAGALRKVVRVFGERAWYRAASGWEISGPATFTRLPLVYERAFGGADGHAAEARNPLGTGFSTGEDEQQIDGLRLPNLEDPRLLLAAPTDRPPPAGFGIIGRDFAPRVTYAGTYDERWRADRCPLLPADFDPRYFNCAHPDLTSARAFKGGEPVRATNVSEGGDVAFRVPRVPVGVALTMRGAEERHAASLDTVLIEPDLHRVVITWRVTVPCPRSLLFVERVQVRGEVAP